MLVRRGIPGCALALVVATAGLTARADPAGETPGAPPPAPPGYSYPAPPPGYGYPPPGYGYPPQGYGYPPGYAYAPPPSSPPPTMPYREGEAIPSGYHLEEHMRRGPVIAGAIVAGVPYAIGLSFAMGDGFPHRSAWLVLPFVGPWIALGARERCDTSANEGWDCVGDVFVRMFLVFDGIMQTTGGALLAYGLFSTKQELVRDDRARLLILPTRVGSGYGVGALGRF